MLSAGMFSALASAMIVRRRGFESGSPPPARAATVSSLMMRVKVRPRFASAAPFLCLIEAHLEWPDMWNTPEKLGKSAQMLPHVGEVRRSREGLGVVRPIGKRSSQPAFV